MGQKTSPIGFRTGITLGWQSTWYASKADYGNFLVEDQKIRRFVDKKYNRQMPKGAVAKVEIIRTRSEVKITLHSGRPGVVIGPRGGEVDRLSIDLEQMIGKKVGINVVEIKDPELKVSATHFLHRGGKVYLRIFPHKPVSNKPLETRMGKGKGDPDFWVARVIPGMVMYEIGGVTEEVAKEALARVAHKMPVRCRFVRRRRSL